MQRLGSVDFPFIYKNIYPDFENDTMRFLDFKNYKYKF